MLTEQRMSLIEKIRLTSEVGRGISVDLEDRLKSFGTQTMVMEGDGNCQFRSLAFNLFGSQRHHAVTRQCVVEHMKRNADFFRVFFEDETEFQEYLTSLGQSRYWGDELTLRAAVEAYGCVAHVIT